MNPKKIIVLLIVLLVFCLSMVVIYNKIQSNQQKKDAYNSIPAFQLLDINGNIVTNHSLQTNKSALFLFFDPECENCKEEFEQINLYRASFPDCQMFFVSTLSKEIIKDFLRQIDFQITDNMFFLCDLQSELARKMNVKGMPSALIYDKNGNLLKNYSGQVKAETLIKYLSE